MLRSVAEVSVLTGLSKVSIYNKIKLKEIEKYVVKNKIVRTWSECKELLLGYPSIYKTFYTEEEAIKFLGGINDKDIPAIKEKIKVNIQSSKRRRSSTKAINFRVPNEVYNEFIKKVDETGLDRDKILLEMIKEWID